MYGKVPHVAANRYEKPGQFIAEASLFRKAAPCRARNAFSNPLSFLGLSIRAGGESNGFEIPAFEFSVWSCPVSSSAHPGATRRNITPRSTHTRVPRTRRASVFPASAMVYLGSPLVVEPPLQLHAFDADYVESLCEGDRQTQEHFVGYFSALLRIKLRSRLQSQHAIEDVCQETFVRVFAVLRKEGGLKNPERLGAFVNSVCNNVLFETYRAAGRVESLDLEDRPEPAATGPDALAIVSSRQMGDKVRQILLAMAPRDRFLLKAVFLEQRDREEVCRQFGVDREYLRVLLHRAKQEFKVEYVKRFGDSVALGAGA